MWMLFQAEAVFGPDALERAARAPGGHIPFTPDAKKALELALSEAIRLKQNRPELRLDSRHRACPGASVTRGGKTHVLTDGGSWRCSQRWAQA